MNILLYYCECGRWKPNSALVCEHCHAERVAAAKRVHERSRKVSLDEKVAPIGVMTYKPREQGILDSINANARRARKRRAFAASFIGRTLIRLGVGWGS